MPSVICLVLVLPSVACARAAHQYNVCDDVDQYFEENQRAVACYAAAYVRTALHGTGALNLKELASFLAGDDVPNVHVSAEQRAAYLRLQINGTRLAHSIGQPLQPYLSTQQKGRKEEDDAIILGLFLGLFRDRNRYTGLVATSVSSVTRGTAPRGASGIHWRWWVPLLVLGPCVVVAAMRARSLVAETHDPDRLAHRRLKRRDKQMDDADSGEDDFY